MEAGAAGYWKLAVVAKVEVRMKPVDPLTLPKAPVNVTLT
jgi:hypothetical protein